jgi:hypothetical protein
LLREWGGVGGNASVTVHAVGYSSLDA